MAASPTETHIRQFNLRRLSGFECVEHCRTKNFHKLQHSDGHSSPMELVYKDERRHGGSVEDNTCMLNNVFKIAQRCETRKYIIEYL